ncbi:MAG: plasmid pRiA4b ORF-3 family protein, partial [Prevotellaceae bacterium]|nr:plasmid pRiA4b ORF-3 family protein [Prevotellaceae bacterium]
MIYSFVIGIKNNKSFMREYHVPAEYSLFDFKRFIVSELDFDDSQQSVFFLLDKNDRKTESYSLFDMGHGAMDTVTLDDLNNKGMEKLLYTFDFFNDRSLYIEFQGETDELPRVYYPTVVQSKGNAPDQFAEKIDDDINKDKTVDDDDDDDENDDDLYGYNELIEN